MGKDAGSWNGMAYYQVCPALNHDIITANT